VALYRPEDTEAAALDLTHITLSIAEMTDPEQAVGLDS
jgi:hypothetical protein